MTHMLRSILAAAALAAAPLLGVPGPAAATPEAESYVAAREHMRRDDWQSAREAARGVARDLVEWARLRAGQGDFADYLTFLQRNGDWPGLDYLRRRGEARIPRAADPAQVLAFFAGNAPETGNGNLRLIEAYDAIGQKGEAEAQAVLAWRTLPLDAEAEAQIFTRYAPLLEPHHEARLDAMLWEHEWEAAERMLPRVGEGWAKLAAARRALARDEAGVDARIEAVPATLATHAGLAYERFAWRARRDRDEDAIALMEARSASAAELGRPAAWAGRRARLARLLMRAGEGERAYGLAAAHHLTEGSDYADLEWLAGYLALTYLQDPVLALDHFNRFRLAVETPISLGRAGYWEGRALEAMGAGEDARAAYAFGAQHQTSFYGLLAAEKAGVAMDPALAATPDRPDWTQAPFAQSTVLQAALILREADEAPRAAWFLRHLAEGLSEGELGQLGQMVLELDDPYLAVRLGKLAADRGIVLPELYYPLHPLARGDLPVAPELALSIARRESEFYVAARSGAGARGLMQLMPRTAEAMAGKLGLAFDAGALTADGTYNAKLGSAYLAQLIEEFGEAPALVAAGYNAGPSRPRRWIEEFGDPRSAGVDPVDWVEHIPFEETRNYIMRVTESLPVYRARLAGQPVPITLTAELKGRAP